VLCDTHDTSILIVYTHLTIPVSPWSRYTAVYRNSKNTVRRHKYREYRRFRTACTTRKRVHAARLQPCFNKVNHSKVISNILSSNTHFIQFEHFSFFHRHILYISFSRVLQFQSHVSVSHSHLYRRSNFRYRTTLYLHLWAMACQYSPGRALSTCKLATLLLHVYTTALFAKVSNVFFVSCGRLSCSRIAASGVITLCSTSGGRSKCRQSAENIL